MLEIVCKKNCTSLVFTTLLLMCLVLACSNSPSSVDELRNLSRESFELLSEADKQSLIEDLHKAAKRGDNEELRRILNRGVSPNATPSGWWTPMMEAASNGHVVIIQSLFEFGANVNQSNDQGLTALMSAAINKQPQIVKLLLESKADVNQKDQNGDTALHKAQMSVCVECVNLLTKAGGKVH